MVRVTGFIVPRREAVSGSTRKDPRFPIFWSAEGDMVTDNAELPAYAAAAQPEPPAVQGPHRRRCAPPAAGLVTEVRTVVGAPASPQADRCFEFPSTNEIELDAEVPASTC